EGELAATHSAGFLQEIGESIQAYDPYLEGIADWDSRSVSYEVVKRLLIDQRRLPELLSMGATMNGLGRLGGAEMIYRDCLLIAPDSERAHYRLGVALGKGGKWFEASRCFASATRLQPGFAAAWYRLSNALNKLGQSQEAKVAFLKARVAT